MANPEQLQLLRQGTIDWNTWRKHYPEIRPDLSFADLSRAILNGADLSRAYLSYTNFYSAELNGADLRWAQLSYADLRDADLTHAIFGSAKLVNAKLVNAKLTYANLTYANLTYANLTGANLNGADLRWAQLSYADLRDAVLTSADLDSANLTGANLTRANLSHAYAKSTIFGNVDLRTAKGLETIHHRGPSTIGIDTILRSEGNIPEAFLRGAGVSDNFISYIRSRVGKSIEYYSCFISYSSKDEEFVKRLHADLQSKGVRCWFAPEDLKTGDMTRDRIDQFISLHDKLLLVLSEHSVNSSWVRFEVEAAFAKEDREKVPVLFPIRLDDAIKESQTSWAAHIWRTRNITNFSNWKQDDAYQKGLTRLLRDLKPETPPTAKPE